MPRNIVAIALHQAVQPLVEQQVGALRHILPWRELAGFQIGAEPLVVQLRLFIAMEVIALLPPAGLAISGEELFQLVEQIGLGPKMAEMAIALIFSRPHVFLHRNPVIAMKAVAFHHDWINILPQEDVFKGFLDSRGSGP